MDMLKVTVNGVEVEAPKGTTVLDAAKLAEVEIPTLCYMRKINEIGACRICMTEVDEGRGKRLVAACVYPISNGMKIYTNTQTVINSRKTTLELILSTHNKKCLSCVRSDNCELQKLCRDLGVEDEFAFKGENEQYEIDFSATHMIRDNSKCVLCRRCVAACEQQGVGVIGPNNRGFKTHISSAYELGLAETSCISCGQCIAVCPVGAVTEKDCTKEVFAALADPDKYVVVQTAPSVRAALGEEFGFPIGTNVEGKMASALRQMGFDGIFDTDFGADLTIMEEANELVERVSKGGYKLPMITSCSPGWVKYCEHYFPDLIDHLSTCKSPMTMQGAVAKTYYAEKLGRDPKTIVSVAIMPCTAKKFERTRDSEDAAGVPDIDYVLTTREFARMIKRIGIKFADLPDGKFDSPFGITTGAAVIFGATGGVMEAALRTASYFITGKDPEEVDFHGVRGTQGIKEASYKIGDLDVKVAVASCTANAAILLEQIRKGESPYTFIEVMACPGGCVNGGGQPQQPMSVRNFTDLRAERAKALYSEDAGSELRCSHQNPEIKAIYAEYFEKPGSHKAHEVLHTGYVKRGM
ncbi:MAG: [FeFe] hydrogenase, group A [Ruminococcus sp.]|jgi:NADP-reducing hydrogenase subunit HndD|nr:[FeFe] hydrogenase, group A [Ruminococcus sp.]